MQVMRLHDSCRVIVDIDRQESLSACAAHAQVLLQQLYSTNEDFSLSMRSCAVINFGENSLFSGSIQMHSHRHIGSVTSSQSQLDVLLSVQYSCARFSSKKTEKEEERLGGKEKQRKRLVRIVTRTKYTRLSMLSATEGPQRSTGPPYLICPTQPESVPRKNHLEHSVTVRRSCGNDKNLRVAW